MTKAEVTTMDGMPMRWRDPAGTMHAVEGGWAGIPGHGNSPLLLWPMCGMSDVPANAAWKGHDPVDCEGCAAKMRGEDWEPSEAQQGLIPIPDGYREP